MVSCKFSFPQSPLILYPMIIRYSNNLNDRIFGITHIWTFRRSDGVVYTFGDNEHEVYPNGGNDRYSIHDDNDALIKFDVGGEDTRARNTEQDKLAFGIRTTQFAAALVRVTSDSSPDFIHVDLVSRRRLIQQRRIVVTVRNVCL